MYNFERELGIEIEDKVVLPPKPKQKRNFLFRFRLIRSLWEDELYIHAFIPYISLSLFSFLIVVEVYFIYSWSIAHLVVLGTLALVTLLMFC